MRKQQIRGLSQPTSVMALGFEYFTSLEDAVTLDGYFDAGGNLFDTAYIYGRGKTEAIFGEWHTGRGVDRSDMMVIGKGAHTPECTPEAIGRQLAVSLDRLKLDYVDVYFMHRDDTSIPVGEFVDAMDAEVQAGRIRGPIGGSNWTRERMDEAATYANEAGKTAPSVLSNNFSLAEMIKPFWAGCLPASDDTWKAWLRDNQMPNFSWSSQGRGFFTDRAGRDKTDDTEMVEAWYSEKNFGRRDRAYKLADELGRTPIQVAVAYVMAQPHPVIPLIGPRTLDELQDSLAAADIDLSDEQVRWLEAG